MSQQQETTESLSLSHDGYFSEVFQTKRIAVAFLKKVLPGETIARLDMDGLMVESRHMTDDLFKESMADVVYRVPIRDTGEHVNFFVVTEHKSYQDFLTIFQLWGYVYRVCRREFQAAKERDEVKADYRLPPVVAIIVHHGETQFQARTQLAELFHPLPGLKHHLPKLQAILFDLNTIDDNDPVLSDPDVPELKVVLMVLKTVFRQDVSHKVKDVLRELKPYSDAPIARRLIRATLVYLAYSAKHLARDYNVLMDTFREVIEEGDKNMPTMVEIWKAEGKAEGEAKGKADDIFRILLRRYDAVPESLAERVRAITDIEKLDRLFDLAFDCETLDVFTKHLD